MTYEALREQIAQQFRYAYALGSCDPKECPLCDCFMDDEGRSQIVAMSDHQAAEAIEWVRREYA